MQIPQIKLPCYLAVITEYMSLQITTVSVTATGSVYGKESGERPVIVLANQRRASSVNHFVLTLLACLGRAGFRKEGVSLKVWGIVAFQASHAKLPERKELSVCVIYYLLLLLLIWLQCYIVLNLFLTCTTCINNNASAGAAIVVLWVMWRQSA